MTQGTQTERRWEVGKQTNPQQKCIKLAISKVRADYNKL
jgi:ribosomal protein L16 Arg81 hydroxylase